MASLRCPYYGLYMSKKMIDYVYVHYGYKLYTHALYFNTPVYCMLGALPAPTRLV